MARTLAFAGTVVSCETTYDAKVARAFSLGELDARWVLTIRVEAADPDAPAAAGEQASFLIHSPTHTLFERYQDVAGKRFAFTVQRDDTAEGTRWQSLTGRRVD